MTSTNTTILAALLPCLISAASCAHRKDVVTVPWQQVSVIDPEDTMPETCHLMDVVRAADGIVGKRDYDYDATVARLRKKAGRLGGNRIKVTETTEKIRTHNPGSEIELTAEVWRCEPSG